MPDMLLRPDRPALAYRAHGGREPTIVFLPGYGSDMNGAKATALAEWSKSEGRAMLRLDYSGCGASEGAFDQETLTSWRDDVLDAIDRLIEGRLVLVGASMGAWLMLLVSLLRPQRVAGLVGIAAAPDATDWAFDDDRRATLHKDGILRERSQYGGSQVATLKFWRSGQVNLLLNAPIQFDGPVRLLYGMADDIVPASITRRLSQAMDSKDVQTIYVKDGDHRLSRQRDIELIVATVARLVAEL